MLTKISFANRIGFSAPRLVWIVPSGREGSCSCVLSSSPLVCIPKVIASCLLAGMRNTGVSFLPCRRAFSNESCNSPVRGAAVRRRIRHAFHRSSCVRAAVRCPKKPHDTLTLPIIQVPLGPSLDWPLRRFVEAS